jgi:hypothetical protein
MGFVRLETDIWLLVGIVVIGELLAFAFFFYFRKSRLGSNKMRLGFGSGGMLTPAYKTTIMEKVERLRKGGQLDETFLRGMSSEERALFEIVLIDALSEWPREDQHRLRMALIKHGYDELCARRSMNETVSDRVRASTLLRLLRPLSQGNTGGLDPQVLNRITPGDDEDDARNEKTKAHGER